MVAVRVSRITGSHDHIPDHLFYGTVRDFETGKIIGRRVLCEVNFPHSNTEKVEVIFHPKPKQIRAFQFVPAVAVRGHSRTGHFIFEANEIWHEGAQTGGRDGISIEFPVFGRASTSKITNLVGRSRSSKIKSGVFWLTPCPLINTATIRTRFQSGTVRTRQIVKHTFTLNSGIRLTFRKYFKRPDREERTSALVAEFKPTSSLRTTSFSAAVDDLDDLLLLSSFALRRSCICTGWMYVDSAGNLTRFFRRNRVPPPDEPFNIDDCLISIRNFTNYLRTVYRKFTRATHKELLRKVVYALTTHGGSIDNRFLRLFAGFESVLLHFIRTNKVTHRLKLREKFVLFQKKYNLDLGDLWPLFDCASGTSLTQIRNRSVHGEYLSEASMRPLIYATENLKWILERMLLLVLGWPIEKSTVSRSVLPYFTMYNWKPMQTKI